MDKETVKEIFDRWEGLAQPYIEKDCKLVVENESFECKAVKDDDFDGLLIAGYLSTFKNVDRHNDVIVEGAYDEAIKELKRKKRLPMLLDHDMRVEKQIGYWNKFALDKIGLYVEGRVSKTPNTEHVIKLIQDGAINTLSVGAMMKYEGQDKKGHDRIIKVMPLEGSVVTIPANPKAEFSQKSLVKSDQVGEPKEKKLTKKEFAEQVYKNLKEKGVI